jgi:serine/threonine protein phosphatase PrpC
VGVCERGFNPDNPDKPCQDALLMHEDAGSDGVLLGVFDGHGAAGHVVAQLLRDGLPRALLASPCFSQLAPVPDNIAAPGSAGEAEALAGALAGGGGGSGSGSSGGGGAGPHRAASQRAPTGAPTLRRNVGGALTEALGALEAALLARRDGACALAGSTACIACVTDGDHLTVANVGDSRAMLLRRGAGGRLAPLGLSVDHKPSLPSEGRRILLAGGSIAPLRYEDGEEGPLRVWAPGVVPPGPGLAVSRSLGDTMGKLAGVSAAPDIYTATLAPGQDAFLVVASDGLWEFVSGADVAGVLERAGERAEQEARDYAAAVAAAEAEAAGGGGGGGGGGAGELPLPRAQLQLALDELVETAVAAWREAEGSVDDIAIVLAEIGAVEEEA